MYPDNTLLPSEAIRLLALGFLVEGPCSYADLAAQVRHLSGRIVGPSLELVGAPLELLKVEGLAELGHKSDTSAEDQTQAPLAITEAGRNEFRRLMNSNMRAPVNELAKLIIAVKVRFLHLLPRDEQALQADLLLENCERELARLSDLRDSHQDAAGYMYSWLEREIAQVEDRLAWCQELTERFGET
jgi:DNA-binding PadR family transcriptional regulator